MAQPYRLTTNPNVILRVADGAHIPNDPANRDFQAFLEWQAEGNTPDPAPLGPPQVVLPQPTTLEADAQGDMDAVTLRQLREETTHGNQR